MVESALNEMVAAVTAARLAGTVLLRSDWCKAALREAETQVGAIDGVKTPYSPTTRCHE